MLKIWKINRLPHSLRIPFPAQALSVQIAKKHVGTMQIKQINVSLVLSRPLTARCAFTDFPCLLCACELRWVGSLVIYMIGISSDQTTS